MIEALRRAYNEERTHSAIGNVTPMEFIKHSQDRSQAAQESTSLALVGGRSHPSSMKKLSINLLLSYSSALVGFIVILLLARILGAENFSWVALGLAIGGFIVPLVNLGSDRTFVRDAIAWSHAGKVDELILSNLSQRVFVLLPISIVLIASILFFTDKITDTVSLVSFSLWAGLIGLYPASWFDYSHDVRRQNLVVLGERVASLLLIGMFYTYTKNAPEVLLIGLCLLATRGFSIFLQIKSWWSHHATIPFHLKLAPPRQDKDGINFHVTIATVANAFLIYGNQLLLASNDNPTELSSYSLASQMMMVAFLFQWQAIRLTSRSIAEACKSQSEILRSLAYNASLLFVGSAILAFGAWIAIHILPHFLADPRFETMSKFAIPLCIWVVLAGVGLAISQHNLAINQEGFYLLASIAGAVVALLLGFVFIPNYGALAVALILLFVHGGIISVNMIRLLYVIRVREA